MRAYGNIYLIFIPNKYRDIQNVYENKASMYMTLNDVKYLTSTCWKEKYQLLTIDMTKDNYTGCYRLGIKSSFVPDSFLFSMFNKFDVTEQDLINLSKLAKQPENRGAIENKNGLLKQSLFRKLAENFETITKKIGMFK